MAIKKLAGSPQIKDERRLYSNMSWIWPIVSPPEDYIEEELHLTTPPDGADFPLLIGRRW